MRRQKGTATWIALGASILLGGCSRANEIVTTEQPDTEQPAQAEPMSSASQLPTSLEVVDVEPADIRAAFGLLDAPVFATVRLSERFDIDGEVVELRETVVSDPSSDISFVRLDHSEVAQAMLAPLMDVSNVPDREAQEGTEWSDSLGPMLWARGLVPRQYTIQDGVAWTKFGGERQTALATLNVLLAAEESPLVEEVLATLESSSAPLDKWVGIKTDDRPITQIPSIGGLLAYRSVTTYVSQTWLQAGVELGDLRIDQQKVVGDRTVVQISDNLTTTLQLEFDQQLRLKAIEQDLSQWPNDSGLLGGRIEIDWEVDQSLLELPAEEDRFNAIDMLASIGLGPECVPEGVVTAADLEAIPELTEVLNQECIDQSPALQAGQAAAKRFAEVEAAISGD